MSQFSNIDVPLSASTSQITNTDIVRPSDVVSSETPSHVVSSETPSHRFSENQRTAMKTGLIMAVFLASGMIMSEIPNLVDKLI